MLRGELGEARFWRSVASYVRDNAQRSVETIDFIRAIESATGRNMRGFFNHWVFRGGHPETRSTCRYGTARARSRRSRSTKSSASTRSTALTSSTSSWASRRAADAECRRPNEMVAYGASGGFARMSSARTKRSPCRSTSSRSSCGSIQAHFCSPTSAYAIGTDLAAAALRGDPGRRRPYSRGPRARQGRHAAPRDRRLATAFEREAFWGVLAEAACALGATRAPWARDVLIGALSHPHPKVVRAAADALGNFRDRRGRERALIAAAQDDASYFVRGCRANGAGKDARSARIRRARCGR